MPADRWRLAALPPVTADVVEFLLGDLPVDIAVPASRAQPAVRAVLADAELVLGDWSGQLAVGDDELADAKRLAFVQQPSLGYEHYQPAELATAGVPLADVAGLNAI